MGVSRNPARPVSGSPAYSPDDLPVYRGGGGAGPAPFTPDDVLAGVTNSFWADPLAGTLYEDASLTTPADTTADPIGGVDNQSSIGTATLSQATTADKLKVSSDGRMERDGTTNTQDLEFVLTVNLMNGFCFAMDVEAAVGLGLFGAGVNLQVIRGSDGAMSVRVGGSTSRNIASVFTANRKRVVITGDATDYEVFVDGVSFGTYATETAQTTYTDIVLGKISTAGTSAATAQYGRLLFAEKDLRANIAQIDAWLEG